MSESANLEDARDALIDSGGLATVVGIENLIVGRAVNSISTNQGKMLMTVEPLRATEGARRLGIPTKDPIRLNDDRKIHHVCAT